MGLTDATDGARSFDGIDLVEYNYTERRAPSAMTAPRAREQRRPPSPPDTLPPRRGGGSSPYINAVCSAGRPADLGCLRGLVRSARALAAAACLSLVCGLALPASAQAQEVTLVSNIGEARSSWGAANPEDYTGGTESRVAQQFTTGPSTGYSLQSVLLDLSASAGPGARVRVGIHRNNNLGNPGRQLVVLDTPAAPFGTNVRFPAATPLSLDADTSYWVVVSNTGHRNSQVFVSVTSSTQQTTTQEFEIADSRKAGKPGTWTDVAGMPVKMKIRGTVPAEKNPTLSGLSLGSGISLTPTFASDTLSYSASVRNNVPEVTLTPTKGAANATIEYLDASAKMLPDADTNTAGHQVALDVGVTTFVVKVTAEDGATTQTYTVTVTRAVASNTAPVWSATMTAGDTQVGHGYDATDTPDTPVIGRLDDDNFDYGSTPEATYPYRVLAIDVASNVVRFVVAPGGLQSDETLTLEFGGHTLAFSDRIAPVSINQSVFWSVPAALDDLDTEFPIGSTATVCLRTATQVCPAGRIVTPSTLPTLSVADAAATEGGDVTFTATLSAAAAADVTATWTASIESGDTAVAADLGTTTMGTVTVTAGQPSGTFDVPTAQDTANEADETFTVTLSGVSTNATLGTATAKGTIDNDDLPVVTIEAGPAVAEGTAASFTLSRTGSTTAALTVAVAVSQAGDVLDDAAAAPATVSFDAGSDEATLSLATDDDDADDDAGTVTVTLGAGTGYRVGAAGAATVAVTDNDVPVDLVLTMPATVAEDAGAVTVTVTATSAENAPPATPVGVFVQRAGGTSASGADHAAVSWDVRIQPSEFTAVTVDGQARYRAVWTDDVTIEDDDLVEGDETLVLSMSRQPWSPAIHTLSGGHDSVQATVTIKDDDLATLSIADAEGDEDEGVEFTLTLSAAAPQDVSVDWTASVESGDSASAEDLATTKTGKVTVDDGETTAKFTVPVNDDSTDEPDQTFTVTLSNPTPASLAQLAADTTATGTIEDEDDPPTLSVADVRHDEGDLFANVTVSLSELSEKRVRFRLRGLDRTGDTASDADWDQAGTAFNIINAGTMSSSRRVVAVINDTLDEDDETLTVEAYDLENAQGSSSDREATITIIDDDPTPTVTVADAAATEGDKVAFTVTLSAVSGRDVTVDYATSVETGDGATSGTDFTAVSSGTLTIAAADSTDTGTIEVQTTEDDASESAETFTLTLSNPTNATLGTKVAATGTINDDDLPVVTIEAGPAVAEGAAAAFTLSRTGSTTAALTVAVAVSQTGDVLDDAAAAPATVSFDAGSGEATLSLATDDDDADDDAGTVTVTLGAGTGYRVGAAGAATVAVTDNDVPVDLVLTIPATVAEDAGAVTVTVTATSAENAPPATPVGVFVQRAGGTSASGADHAAVSWDVRIQPSEFTAVTVDGQARYRAVWTDDVTIEDDDLVEGDETLVLSMSRQPWSPAIHTMSGGHDSVQATVTIEDDDLATLSIADAEGDEDEGVEFTLTLSAAAPQDVSVDWTASVKSGDSASTADLATTKTGTVTVEDGDTTKKFTVPLNDDSTDEPDQTFTVTLSNPTPASLAQLAADTTATGTIEDEDDAPTLTVADLRHDENDTFANQTVSLSEVSEKQVRFRLRQVDRAGDTASDADWNPRADNALNYISAGTMSVSRWQVSMVNDTLDEDDETLTVEAYDLENAQGSSSDREATITIIDDDPTPTVTVADAAATEGDKVEFTVTLSALSGLDVEVDYATTETDPQSAVSGTDFTAASGTLEIEAGNRTGTIDVQTTEDDASESAETFTLTISNPDNATLGAKVAATGTINDDDANAAPTFSSSAEFDAAENQTSAGTVLATDGDTGDDITGYAITGGADQNLFSIGATSGALTFDDAPNFEAPSDANTDNDYVVTVQATSGTGERVKTATQTITVTVTDVAGEAPGKPDAPDVAAASVSSLTVSWSAPANAGPAIDDYDVRYRAGTTGDWSDGNHVGTAVTATLSSLSENTSYQVQVRATNDEGTGSWSDSGSGSTDANAAPTFSSSAEFDAAENQTAAGTVLATDGDTDDDVTGYAITGGADQAFFSIGATSGALTFDAAPNFEDAQDQGTNNTYVV